jgi:hypothetical protein
MRISSSWNDEKSRNLDEIERLEIEIKELDDEIQYRGGHVKELEENIKTHKILASIDTQRFGSIQENNELSTAKKALQHAIDRRVELFKKSSKLKQEFEEKDFFVNFGASEEIYFEGLAAWAKLGIAATSPALAWSIYSPNRIWEVLAISFGSIFLGLMHLSMNVNVARQVRKQVRRKGSKIEVSVAVSRGEINDRIRAYSVYGQWLALFVAWGFLASSVYAWPWN